MKSHRTKLVFVYIIIFICCLIISDLMSSQFALSVSYYSLSDDRIKEIRIIQISDLHNSEFGNNNHRLIETVAAQNPDLIMITGDLLNSNEDSIETATCLIENLTAIADVYVSMGNHEIEYRERTGIDINSLYTDAGAVVLDETYIDISINSQELRIGGVYGYCLPERYKNQNPKQKQQCELLTEFQKTNRYKILMSHLPYAWWNYGFGNEWNVDLVLCGHTHGGQVIVPFIGGLYDGETGWFPGQVSGYKKDGADIIVSRGLGNTEDMPRLINIPEIVVIEINLI